MPQHTTANKERASDNMLSSTAGRSHASSRSRRPTRSRERARGAAGLTDLGHELDRCRRTTTLLVVAYVDVVGLKTVNDTQGHGAADDLLKRVVALMKAHLCSYDLVIRLAGDEFLCVMSNMALHEARQRFSAIGAAPAAAPCHAAIGTGFAELAPGQPVAELIARADKELIESRHGSHR
jgi:diguanylate cyclase (GGDEF)-like protein